MKIILIGLVALGCVACSLTSSNKAVSVHTPLWVDQLGSHACFTCFPSDVIKFQPKTPSLPVTVLPTITILAKRKISGDELCSVINTGVLRADINEKLDCAIKILKGEN